MRPKWPGVSQDMGASGVNPHRAKARRMAPRTCVSCRLGHRRSEANKKGKSATLRRRPSRAEGILPGGSSVRHRLGSRCRRCLVDRVGVSFAASLGRQVKAALRASSRPKAQAEGIMMRRCPLAVVQENCSETAAIASAPVSLQAVEPVVTGRATRISQLHSDAV